jgi:hypothetical protein
MTTDKEQPMEVDQKKPEEKPEEKPEDKPELVIFFCRVIISIFQLFHIFTIEKQF